MISIFGSRKFAYEIKQPLSKAKLQKEGIFVSDPFICQRHFINVKVGN